MIRQTFRLLCQGHEHSLGYVLGKMPIARHAQRGGMDEIKMPVHQFGERLFATVIGEITQQTGIRGKIHFTYE